MAAQDARISYANIQAWITAFAQAVRENRDHLTELDAAIGDADHGANLDRGMQVVLAKLSSTQTSDIGSLLKTVGMTLVSTVGGASGPLYGTIFLRLGQSTVGKETLTAEDWLAALRSGVEGVVARGKASPGDKTMVDALDPALRAAEGSADLGELLRRAAEAAERGAVATIPLVARKGRASYLGERSAGHQDPGATSAALLLQTAADTLAPSSASQP